MLIDVHNHSMPGVDDGSQDSDMTFQMLQMAYEEGIRAVILTPHYKSTMSDETTQKRYAAYRKACLMAEKVSPRLKLYLGEELYYDSKMVQRLREGRALTLNGTQYVLAEFPVMWIIHIFGRRCRISGRQGICRFWHTLSVTRR